MKNNKILERFLSQEFTPKVKIYYRSLLTGFQEYLITVDKDFHNFKEEDVRNYYDKKIIGEFGRKWERDSVYTFLTVLHSFCLWLYKDLDNMMIGKRDEKLDDIIREKVRLNKIMSMKKPPIVSKLKTNIPVSPEALQKIFTIMIKDKHNHNMKKYAFKRFWCSCWFGCRVGELTTITPDMVMLDENKIHFITEKTLLERMNFYDDFTKQFMEEYLDNHSLFNVTEQAFWSCIKRYSDKVGHKVYPKMGREAWNTNMSKKITDINYVKVICGHSVKGLNDMTAVYTNYPPEEIKRIMTKEHYLIPLEKEMQDLLDKY